VLELSAELIERCDDRDAVLRDGFHQASAALGQVALAATGMPQNLADQVWAAVVSVSDGPFDPIVRDLGTALGGEGLAHLRQRLESLRQRSSGSTTAKSKPDWVVSIAMLDIADAPGDGDGRLAKEPTVRPLGNHRCPLARQPQPSRHLSRCQWWLEGPDLTHKYRGRNGRKMLYSRPLR